MVLLAVLVSLTTQLIFFQVNNLPQLVSDLVRGKTTWEEVEKKYGLFEGQTTSK